MTDHHALKFLAGKDPSTGCLARWFNMDFTFRYRPGLAIGNADALSRQVWPDDKDTSLKEGKNHSSDVELINEHE